ncbi:DeoR/GlpR family DNA-binding transcription regulator [Fodinicurvata fenggangensis]|uniref:DeoR/GlpR family DNA-binding transcription regulator n=1 Tax=Fodinicurvata fenggangensis TaxID=1121830 RepID=UPI00047C0E2C|nr:DeoR/GlpR family DNA-binding transcription regulator [Fodinicurvata fenggangensis]
MWQEERRQRIRSRLATFGHVSVDQVTSEFGVSRETIRRDLLEMEAHGELRRMRGGAIPVAEEREAPYTIRSSVRVKEKRSIAACAARLVESGQTLFLDAGSTTEILSERLSGLSGLTIITNSLKVASNMTEHESAAAESNRIVLVGGEFNSDPPCTFGDVTINEIGRYHADLALLSPFGLDAGKGATSYDPHEAEVARSMSANATRTAILADHSKIGIVSRISFCPIPEIAHLVVDAKAPQKTGFDAIEALAQDVMVGTQ